LKYGRIIALRKYLDGAMLGNVGQPPLHSRDKKLNDAHAAKRSMNNPEAGSILLWRDASRDTCGEALDGLAFIGETLKFWSDAG